MNTKEYLTKRSCVLFRVLIAWSMVLFQPVGAQTVSYPSTSESLPCLDKEFSIFVHVIEDSLGNGGISATSIREQVEEMNVLFAPICTRFSVCNVEYYPTYQFKNIWKPDQVVEMEKRYFVKHVINLFVIESQNLVAGEFCGFGRHLGINNPYSGSIFVYKNCLQPTTIAHQLGHYFGLLHTWTGSGIELVDGSNCATEGDQICDTPADPFDPEVEFPPYLGQDRENCLFVYPETDANGEYYRPDVGNIMSAYQDCYCGFTRQQLELMAKNYLVSSTKKW